MHFLIDKMKAICVIIVIMSGISAQDIFPIEGFFRNDPYTIMHAYKLAVDPKTGEVSFPYANNIYDNLGLRRPEHNWELPSLDIPTINTNRQIISADCK